jgi:hypothetical protein
VALCTTAHPSYLLYRQHRQNSPPENKQSTRILNHPWHPTHHNIAIPQQRKEIRFSTPTTKTLSFRSKAKKSASPPQQTTATPTTTPSRCAGSHKPQPQKHCHSAAKRRNLLFLSMKHKAQGYPNHHSQQKQAATNPNHKNIVIPKQSEGIRFSTPQTTTTPTTTPS